MKNFFDSYQPLFDTVVRLLGNGWRINLLDDCQYRIKLTSPQYKNYSIHIRMHKQRLLITGNVNSRTWRSQLYSCTVSPHRNPVDISEDIKRKILVNAKPDIDKAQMYERNRLSEQEGKQIIKGMLSQLVELENWHGTLTGFRASNGLTGCVAEQNNGYEMLVRGADLDQLIKLAGLIKEL